MYSLNYLPQSLSRVLKTKLKPIKRMKHTNKKHMEKQ